MKYVYLAFSALLCILICSCSSTKKLYEMQSYDELIIKESSKFCKGHGKSRNIVYLGNSYHRANQNDHDRIIALRASGEANIWPEIYQRYRSMDGRCKALACLPDTIKKTINYQSFNIDSELSHAQRRAEQYLVAKTSLLLKSDNPEDIPEAKSNLDMLRNISPRHQRLEELNYKLMLTETNNTLLKYAISDKITLPQGFDAVVMDFDTRLMSDSNHKYYLHKAKGITPSLTITIRVIDKKISPEKMQQVTFKEEKDGVSAIVTDKTMTKDATIKGVVEYRNAQGHIIMTSPFEVSSKFAYNYSTLKGDKAACSEHTLTMIQKTPIPFPSDESMLLDAARQLNTTITETLKTKTLKTK